MFSPHLRLTRRTLIAAMLATPALARAAPAPCPPPTVLFVCPAGTVKSAIAREVLKAQVRKAGLAVQVRSRGLVVEDHVTPALAASLRADGIDPAAESAKPLTDADVAQADIVIAFDDAAAAPSLVRARAWRTPSWNADYAAARDDLDRRMVPLLAELRARHGAGCAGR